VHALLAHANSVLKLPPQRFENTSSSNSNSTTATTATATAATATATMSNSEDSLLEAEYANVVNAPWKVYALLAHAEDLKKQ
jgi:hypothetical protein